MGYKSLFEGSGLHNSKLRLQITNDMFKKGNFMLLFDLTHARGASHHENGNIRFELKFNKTLPAAITCLLYLEFDNSVPFNLARNITKDF